MEKKLEWIETQINLLETNKEDLLKGVNIINGELLKLRQEKIMVTYGLTPERMNSRFGIKDEQGGKMFGKIEFDNIYPEWIKVYPITKKGIVSKKYNTILADNLKDVVWIDKCVKCGKMARYHEDGGFIINSEPYCKECGEKEWLSN